jgi:hypothetical protein
MTDAALFSPFWAEAVPLCCGLVPSAWRFGHILPPRVNGLFGLFLLFSDAFMGKKRHPSPGGNC